jgi:hypothetical protein
MKQERGLKQKDGLGYRYNYKLLNQSWLERKLEKVKRRQQGKKWCNNELKQFGMSIHGIRSNEDFLWI